MGTLPIRPVSASLPPSLIEDKELSALSIIYPDLFAEVFLQTSLWDIQKQILHAVAAKPRVAVKACHASGKTYLAARALLWFLARYESSTVVTTAPTWQQVERLLWGEVHSALLKSRYPFPKALKTELEINSKRLAYGLSTSVTKSDEGVKFQGIHNDHILVILDEAPGVESKIWEAIAGIAAGGDVHILAIGNPTIASGPFHDAFTKGRATWETFTISAFDTPNLVDIPGHNNHLTKEDQVVEGSKLHYLLQMSDDELNRGVRTYLTTRAWVKDRFYVWGPGHPAFQSRVLGDFPKQSEDALFSLAWLEFASTDARLRDKPGEGKYQAGIDVAGPGDAETVLTVRRGPRIVLHKAYAQSDARGDVVADLMQYKGELEAVNVDVVGMGEYFAKHLADLKFPVVDIVAQHASSDPEAFKDVKAEFYWGLRKRFEDGDISGLSDDTTIGQLAGIRYKHNSRGQVEIESKDDARKRGVPSPDRAESIMLAFGMRKLCYGVLEYNKQQAAENMNKIPTSSMIKPNMPDNAQSCPNCGAACVIAFGNGFRCNNCANQWTVKKDEVKPYPSRGDFIKIQSRQQRALGKDYN